MKLMKTFSSIFSGAKKIKKSRRYKKRNNQSFRRKYKTRKQMYGG